MKTMAIGAAEPSRGRRIAKRAGCTTRHPGGDGRSAWEIGPFATQHFTGTTANGKRETRLTGLQRFRGWLRLSRSLPRL